MIVVFRYIVVETTTPSTDEECKAIFKVVHQPEFKSVSQMEVNFKNEQH